MRNVIETLRRVAAGAQAAATTDAELLERFIAERDEVAFEALVRRHGPMVLGVCRRILRHSQDAEDAFQATFLVLVRKAATVAPREVVGSWLYSVARLTARKVLAGNLRRGTRERGVERLPEPGIVPPEPTGDLAALLDAEMAALPEAYRAALVLCDLEGHTGRDAARQLGWPEGTLFTRLARGRKLLADRLARRGVGPFAALALPALPPALVTTTIQAASATILGPAAATALVSSTVATLTEGVLQAMIPLKLKLATTAAVVLVVVGAAVAGGQYVQGPGTSPAPVPVQRAVADPPADNVAQGRKSRTLIDQGGDGFSNIWVDLGFPLTVNRRIPHPTTNCMACHTDKTLETLQLLALQQKNARLPRNELYQSNPTQPAQDPHVAAGLAWLYVQQQQIQMQKQQQLEKLALSLDRQTLLDLLRLVERRDATLNALQNLDQSLDKLRQETKDPKAERATIDALIRHLQERKEQLGKPLEPKKP